MASDASGGVIHPVDPADSQWNSLLRRLGIWIGRLEQAFLAVFQTPKVDFHSARVLATAVAAGALGLWLVQATLYVSTGWGIEDFLGWTGADATAAMNRLWADCQRLYLAWGYLAFDSALFLPIYVAFFLLVGLRFAALLAADRGHAAGSAWERHALLILATPVTALVPVDLIENAVGLARLPEPGATLAIVASSAALIVLVRLPVLRLAFVTASWRLPALAGVLALVLLGIGAWQGGTCSVAPGAVDGSAWPVVVQLGCGAHRAKQWLTGVVIALPLLAALAWLFAMLRPRRGPDDERGARARLRAAIGDCLLRSRYVLIALAIFAGLAVVMDQSRDVVAAVASFVPRLSAADWGESALLTLGSLAVFAASALALWLFVFACWLWTRSACQLRSAQSLPRAASDDALVPCYEDVFARDWARVLSMVPVLLVVMLCARVIRDVSQAQLAPLAAGEASHGWWHCASPSLGVLAFGVAVVIGGGLFLARRAGQADATTHPGYYDCLSWQAWCESAGFSRAGPAANAVGAEAQPAMPPPEPTAATRKYSLAGHIDPYRLPIVALLAALGCRLLDVFPGEWLAWHADYVPTMVLPVMLLALSFWLCFFGWLSMLEIHRAVPWVLILLIAVGAAAGFGLTDNHRVWTAIEADGGHPGSALKLWLCTAGLALLVIRGYVWAMRLVARYTPGAPQGDGLRPKVGWTLPAALLAGVAALAAVGDHWAGDRRPLADDAPASPPPVAQRPSLDAALAAWLTSLCQPTAAEPLRCVTAPQTGGRSEVYFVSSEGGGIRAAVWTALMLERAAQVTPRFEARTFSISAVSGGSVGAAVYRACSAGLSSTQTLQGCIEQFARRDLLSPLLSSWMFEDPLARLIPSAWLCETPGCGFLSRGAWFEQTMESAMPQTARPGLRAPLFEPRTGAAHRPHLLLNATWIETGERAIASDLRIATEHFAGAKDQLAIIDSNLSLGSAAHNSARFPYTNSIGVLQATRRDCAARDEAGAASAPSADSAASAASATSATPPMSRDTRRRPCGHLGDGGYFDNGGAQSTLDVLQAFGRCLRVTPGDADAALYPACLAMPPAQRDALRAQLLPVVLVIRHQASAVPLPGTACAAPGIAPSAEQVRGQSGRCGSDIGVDYRPARPVCGGGAPPFVELVGPLVAAIQVGGIGAAGRLAEARQAAAVVQLRTALGVAPSAAAQAAPVRALTLVPAGQRFPLGWHLSPAAVDGLVQRANACNVWMP